MTNLVDIIRYIIGNMNLSLTVSSIVGDKLYMCNTLFLSVGKVVTDSQGNLYEVTAVSLNEYIEVLPSGHSNPFTGSKVTAPPVLFLHGTPSSTNNEYLKLHGQRTLKKTPFIWLLESYEYDNLPTDSSVMASYKVRLFFMDWANLNKWRNDEHNENAIKPMESLVRSFINAIEDDYIFKTLGSTTSRVRPRFGVEVNNKGSEKTIIHEGLSGVDLTLTLEIYDTTKCCRK